MHHRNRFGQSNLEDQTLMEKKVREETVFKHMRLQLTVVHVHHFSGVPAREVCIELWGRPKHCGKKVVRKEKHGRNHLNNLLKVMSVTSSVFHLEMSWLKE